MHPYPAHFPGSAATGAPRALSYPDGRNEVEMGYHERPVPGPLRAAEPALGAIACLWQQTAPPLSGSRTRVVPDGCIDVIWSRADGAVHVAGPDTAAVLVAWTPGERYAGVRFRPGTAPQALGVAADALRDARVPLAELWGGTEAERIAESVAGAADRPAALLAATAPRLRNAPPPDPLARAILAAAAQPGGDRSGLGVGALADRLGLSERQLRRRSLAAFGYGPKTLQRVLRFQRALRLARRGAEFGTLAYDAGYADQAHLSREVRALGGVPLGTLIGR
jgi:AraC-like DNA-binding protein